MLIAFLFFIFINQSYASVVTLQWDANTGPDIDGYKVYYGKNTNEYDSLIVMSIAENESPDPNTVEFTVNGLTGGNTYYFALKAYDNQSRESGYSNEVSVVLGYDDKEEGGYHTNEENTGGSEDTNDTKWWWLWFRH